MGNGEQSLPSNLPYPRSECFISKPKHIPNILGCTHFKVLSDTSLYWSAPHFIRTLPTLALSQFQLVKLPFFQGGMISQKLGKPDRLQSVASPLSKSVDSASPVLQEPPESLAWWFYLFLNSVSWKSEPRWGARCLVGFFVTSCRYRRPFRS